MGHKCVRPNPQPRTLRSRAEDMNDAANFGDAVVEKEPQQTDVAEQARPTVSRKGNSAADKQPFNLRGK